FLLSCGFTVTQIAHIRHTSISTVKQRLRNLVAGNDQLGPEAVRAQLRTEGTRVQRCRVRSSMHRVNPRAAALRAMSQRLRRRAYRVTGPNSYWHLDGNHKLNITLYLNHSILLIVIHGAIDGYSRLVTFLQASNNNRSSTVMNCFLDAISKYGVPSRVRTDHGGENNAVCLFMNLFRGTERGSALRGRSTHNQRIERLWVDLWRGVSNVYYDLFHFLESEGIVDVDNEMHINFTHQWNKHGLRTERHQSPLQIFVRGCLTQVCQVLQCRRYLQDPQTPLEERLIQQSLLVVAVIPYQERNLMCIGLNELPYLQTSSV
uniref:Integrase catalytic domain-containing protein n=1 Tax=Cyprinus carpio TaxID=7962 RepID=A0A8C1RZZ8_CYPCA